MRNDVTSPCDVPNPGGLSDDHRAVDALLASTGLAIVFVDTWQRVLRMTPTAATLLQIDDAVQGRSLREIATCITGDGTLTGAVSAVLATQQPLETMVHTEADQYFTLRVHPYPADGSAVQGAVLTFIDITEARRAQEALRESERFLRESQRIGRIGGYITDLSTGVWKVSPEMYEIFGIDESYPHTLEGWAAFLHPDTRDELFNYHLHVERERLRFDYEYKIVRINDGAVRWVHGLGDLEFDEHNNPVRRIGTIQDITERRLAQEELRIAAVAFESQNRMIITDPAGVILRVNTAFIRTTGYSAAEAVGKTPGMLMRSERHDAQFYKNMWDTLLSKGRWQGEIWNKYKNGNIYASLLTITAVSTHDQGVTHYVGSFADISEDKEVEAEIHRLAFYDPLTRLPNRRLLQERLGQALRNSTRSNRYGALFFVDLDNFKGLNDSRGHDAGDLLLIEMAQRLQAVLREGDTVARQGGDEFVLLLENLSGAADEASVQARQIAEKLMAAVARPFNLKGLEYFCKLSIGIAMLHGGDSVEELFKHADLALYEAKAAGRNTHRFYDPVLRAALDQRHALEQEMSQALQAGQFLLFYQPQVDNEQRVVGVEALLRWQHPQRGLVLPEAFIPVAEDTGCIHAIGLWALASACRQLRQWQRDARTRHLQIAVNVSPRQFRQEDFVDQVRAVLHDTGADPTRLKFELTESLVLENVEDSIAKMQMIQALGISFAMDDFGTGYSSLSYLAQLPLQQLKIDRSFVRNLSGQRNDETITRTIITMGQGLGMDVIAEGVETEAQQQFLRSYGCHLYQGNLFSEPLAPEKLQAWLAGHMHARAAR